MSMADAKPFRDKSELVDRIATSYLLEHEGDAGRALRRIISDALADLLETEQRNRRAERLLSRGYVRGRLEKGR